MSNVMVQCNSQCDETLRTIIRYNWQVNDLHVTDITNVVLFHAFW